MITLTELITFAVSYGYDLGDVERAYAELRDDPTWADRGLAVLFRAVTSDALTVKPEPRRTRV